LRTISISISGIKNIKKAFIEFPLQKGVSVIVGGNGSGKSTILQSLSQSFSMNSLRNLSDGDFDTTSKVEINLDGATQVWSVTKGWRWQMSRPRAFSLNGMYEGSLFYGSRFDDSRLVDDLLHKGKLSATDIVDADDYMKAKMSYILAGEVDRYSNLKRIRRREIAQNHGLNNTPYFNKVGTKLISQYRMSSGECLLLSLLHFVYNAIVRRSLPENQLILVLIDEIELALHPIAVHRFIETIDGLVEEHDNLMVILTSHSPEVIRRIKPKNIYKIENNNGEIGVINPGYPSYVIRDIYKHDGFDTLILTEDILAKIIVQKVIDRNDLSKNKLLHVVPAGGWENVLSLHNDLLKGNVLGLGKNIFSIIDGDVAEKCHDKYKNLKKFFLPIESVEKFLLSICKNNKNATLKKKIGDKYFTVKSLSELTAEHVAKYPQGTNSESKKFYARLLADLSARRITEEVFVERLADDILAEIDFSSFGNNLKTAVE